MNIEELRALYQSEDFQPFEVTLRGGLVFRVETRDHIWVTPAGTVHLIEGTDGHRVFDRTRIEVVRYKEKS